ncbi:MAG: hypothetical protein KY475_24050 [Planctomycetes bacterium]|nr:hypothetical protein [Planctomycetota bacterium]
METPGSVIVQGRAGYLLVPIVVIAACAIGAPLYYKDSLPDFCIENAVKVLATAAAVEAALLVSAAFLAGRRIILQGPKLYYRSWLARREIDVSEISDLSLETDHSVDSASTSYIVLWSAGGPLLRLNPLLWDRPALAVLLQKISERNPRIQVAREVRPYVSV